MGQLPNYAVSPAMEQPNLRTGGDQRFRCLRLTPDGRYTGRHGRKAPEVPMKLLLIACGGALGSVARYLVALAAHNYTAAATTRILGHVFPVGTLAVNLIGCLLIGVLAALFNRHVMPHEHYRLALTVGVLGGFTTF